MKTENSRVNELVEQIKAFFDREYKKLLTKERKAHAEYKRNMLAGDKVSK